MVNDLLAEARAELYQADPGEFTARRAALAAAAREAGQPEAASQIGTLRKPTRSAWVLNQLVRTCPDVPRRLALMAADLREGGDGARIRELTQARSRLIDELARQAFAAAGLDQPPAALREDVAATLGAALADPEVAASLAAGTLVRAVHWAGFGEIGLAMARHQAQTPAAVPAQARQKRGAAPPPSRAELLARSQRAVAEATEHADAAAGAERDLERRVRELETELARAREQLAQARRDSYRAEARRRKAADELARIRE